MAKPSNLADAIRRCRLRATPARLAILRVLRVATSPLSHQDVVDRLGPLGRDRTTVYRNLHQLTAVGLLRRVVVGERLYRFVAVGDRSAALHAEFVCDVCGHVEQLSEIHLLGATTAPRAVARGQITLRVLGTCNACL